MSKKHILFHCGICECLHPWMFVGDCRDDKNRFDTTEHYITQRQLPTDVTIFDIEVREWEERLDADMDEGIEATRKDTRP